jgi:hypothetical protein
VRCGLDCSTPAPGRIRRRCLRRVAGRERVPRPYIAGQSTVPCPIPAAVRRLGGWPDERQHRSGGLPSEPDIRGDGSKCRRLSGVRASLPEGATRLRRGAGRPRRQRGDVQRPARQPGPVVGELLIPADEAVATVRPSVARPTMVARTETRNSPSDNRPDRTSRTAAVRRVCGHRGGSPAKGRDREDPTDQTKQSSESHVPLQSTNRPDRKRR